MKKALSALLVICMLLTLLPAPVSAVGTLPFSDVKESDWFYDSVDYVYVNSLMIGTSGTTFAPSMPVSRGMLVTVLWRMEGCPEASDTTFNDVHSEKYYSTAVAWAEQNGIVKGYGDGTFRPNTSVTREEMVTVFNRYSDYKGYDISAQDGMGAYSDHAAIQPYAEDAMCWAVAIGLIQGFPDGTIRPKGNSSRAELATVLMRFVVKFSEPDDGTDKEDTEVTGEDRCVLSVSGSEFMTNSDVKITFYVNSTLTVPYFELYLNGESTGILLYDTGDYDGVGDDIPNDGCYTAVQSTYFSNACTLSYTAVATIGGQTVTTNVCQIIVIDGLTNEQIDFAQEVTSKVAALMKEINAKMDESTSEAEKTVARYEVIYAFLEKIRAEGIISDLEYNEESYVISYSIDDVEYGVMCYDDTSASGEGFVASYGTAESDYDADMRPSQNATLASVDINLKYTTYKEEALVMNYCAANVTSAEDEAGAYWISFNPTVNGMLENAGFNVENRYEVTIDDFKNMQDYQLVVINCHGSYYGGGLFVAETPVICTEQEVTNESQKTYQADLKAKRVCAVTTTDGDNVYWIKPDFFSYYYKSDPLNASIFYVGCCKGAFNNSLVNAIKEAGADSVVAYSDTVYVGYNMNMLIDIIEDLLTGDTINEAVNAAKVINGADDMVGWGLIKVDPSDRKSEIAVCNVFGNTAAPIHNTLHNGNFDNMFDFLGNGIISWKKYGDARSIFRLAGLEPISAPKMAIISSGFGSMNDETTSSIYQTFLVPGDANTIAFTYDVISEEPMEYVGSKFNDMFQVDILNTDGEILETLAYESVNTSTWYAIDGINFPGGDDTTYHTRWKTINSDAIAKYRGQLIVLRFAVQDAGDAIYDTAVLIDSVTVS